MECPQPKTGPGDVVPMASVGSDFEPYSEWMNEQGIDQTYVKRIANSYTAQAYITTDKDDNQITAFHPGAMNYAHENRIPADSGIKFGIVAPDGRDGMLQHADQFSAAGIPFIFDPGQGLPKSMAVLPISLASWDESTPSAMSTSR